MKRPASSSKAASIPFFELQSRLGLRSDIQIRRKVFHASVGLLMVGIYSAGMSRGVAMITLGSILSTFMLVEILRIRFAPLNEFVMKVFAPIMRTNEVKRVSGMPYYVAGALVAVALFSKPVALLSILCLALGDPIASFAGINWGDRSIRFKNGKSLIGTLAGIIACTAIVGFFMLSIPAPLWKGIAVTLVGGIAGGTAELIPVKVDDNVSIPIVTGLVVTIAMFLLQFHF